MEAFHAIFIELFGKAFKEAFEKLRIKLLGNFQCDFLRSLKKFFEKAFKEL